MDPDEQLSELRKRAKETWQAAATELNPLHVEKVIPPPRIDPLEDPAGAKQELLRYQRTWREYKGTVKIAWRGGLGGVLVLSAISMLGEYARWLFPLVGLIVALLIGAPMRLKCPRCGHDFYRNRQLGDSCRSCSLPKWAGPDGNVLPEYR